MKSPMNQRPDEEAHQATEAFIAKYARKPGTAAKAPKTGGKKARAAVAKDDSAPPEG
jgi:hypothetical protein